MRTLPHHCMLTLIHTPMGRASSHAMEHVNIWGSSSAVGGRALGRMDRAQVEGQLWSEGGHTQEGGTTRRWEGAL